MAMVIAFVSFYSTDDIPEPEGFSDIYAVIIVNHLVQFIVSIILINVSDNTYGLVKIMIIIGLFFRIMVLVWVGALIYEPLNVASLVEWDLNQRSFVGWLIFEFGISLSLVVSNVIFLMCRFCAEEKICTSSIGGTRTKQSDFLDS